MLKDFKYRMDRSLNGLGWGDSKRWIEYALIISGILFAGSMLLASGLWRMIFGIMSFLPMLGMYMIPIYFWSSKQKAIDSELPQALYRVASNAFVPMDELIKELGDGNNELASEFKKASMQMKNGISVEKALEAISIRNDSRLLKRTISLLLESYRTGADMSIAFKETAEEISGIATVSRTLGASTTIEKYTLLLAGGVIVPLVLGTLISLVGSLNFTGLMDMGFGTASADLLPNAMLGSQIYILEYALLASVFVAYQESSIEKAVVYAAVLVPLSMALFMLANSGIFV